MRRTIVSLIAGAALVLAPIAASAEGVPVVAPNSGTTQNVPTGPLAPAAPAGVQQAQGSTNRGPLTVILGGAAALVGGVLALAGGSNGGNGPAATSSSTGSAP